MSENPRTGTVLLDHPILQMRHALPFNHADLFQLWRYIPKMLEQPHAFTQHHGRQINRDFINQPCTESLLQRLRCADGDIFIASNRFGLPNRALDAVRDEGERGAFLVCLFLRNTMRQYHHRHIRWMVTAPCLSNVEGLSSGNQRAHLLNNIIKPFGAGRRDF